MLALGVIVVATFGLAGYDMFKLSKARVLNLNKEAREKNANDCTESDYDFFDKRK